MSSLLVVIKIPPARWEGMPLCFVENFQLNRLNPNICQTHPFLPGFCQLWLVKLPLSVFFKFNQQISGRIESFKLGNLEDFVSEALFVPSFTRYTVVYLPLLLELCRLVSRLVF